MGVRDLQWFMESYCPGGYYTVKIAQLVDDYRARNPNGITPVIAVDANACVLKLYAGLDWVTGGQFRHFETAVRSFVDSFRNLGIRLVFFFDGPSPDEKRDTLIDRCLEYVERSEEIFDILRAEGRSGIEGYDRDPPGLNTVFMYVLRKVCNAEIRTPLAECDGQIALFGRVTPECIAVISQDTDFIILDTGKHCRYLSINSFDLQTMEASTYDRAALCDQFDLTVDHLPVLATLLANDYVTREELRVFHRRLVSRHRAANMRGGRGRQQRGQMNQQNNLPFQLIIECVSDYLRPLDPFQISLSDLADEVFCDRSYAALLEKSIAMYRPEPEAEIAPLPPLCMEDIRQMSPADQWRRAAEEVTQRVRSGSNLVLVVYGVMNDREYGVGSFLEDLRGADLPPIALLFRKLRQHIYGILLKDSGDGGGLGPPIVEEWCAVHPESLDAGLAQPDRVPAVAIRGVEHPGLLRLWYDDGGSGGGGVCNRCDSGGDGPGGHCRDGDFYGEVNDMRWIFVRQTFSLSDTQSADIRRLPEHILIPVLVLYYIQRLSNWSPVLQDWEIDAFVALMVHISQSGDDLAPPLPHASPDIQPCVSENESTSLTAPKPLGSVNGRAQPPPSISHQPSPSLSQAPSPFPPKPSASINDPQPPGTAPSRPSQPPPSASNDDPQPPGTEPSRPSQPPPLEPIDDHYPPAPPSRSSQPPPPASIDDPQRPGTEPSPRCSQPAPIDVRAVQVASMFSEGVAIVSALLAVLRPPEQQEYLLPSLFFDGPWFQHYYQLAHRQCESGAAASAESLLGSDPDAAEQFRTLRSLV